MRKLALSAEDLERLQSGAREALLEPWHPTINELCVLQDEQNPVRLTPSSVERITARYRNSFQASTTRLAADLCEAFAYRSGLGIQEQDQVADLVSCYVHELTREVNADHLYNWIASYFTIGNPDDARRLIATRLSWCETGAMRETMKVIQHSRAKYGPRVPSLLRPRRGRKTGEKFQETVDLERVVQQVYAFFIDQDNLRPSAREVVRELLRRKAPLPRTWRRQGITWNRVLSDPLYLKRFRKRLSKMNRDARPAASKSFKPQTESSTAQLT